MDRNRILTWRRVLVACATSVVFVGPLTYSFLSNQVYPVSLAKTWLIVLMASGIGTIEILSVMIIYFT